MQTHTLSPLSTTRTIQLYCEMIPLPLLGQEPFLGEEPLLSQMRDFIRQQHGESGPEIRLELVLRVTLHPHDQLLGKHKAIIAELLQKPERWGLDTIRLWPQLTDDEGVYLNGSSVGLFFQRLHRLLDHLDDAGIPFPPLLYDLEPSKHVLDAFLVEHRGVLAAGREALRRALGSEARTHHARMAAALFSELERIRSRYSSSRHGIAGSCRGVPMHTASVFPAFRGRFRVFVEQALATPTVEPMSGQAIFDGLEGMAYGSLARYAMPDSLQRWAPALGTEYVRLIASQHSRWCSDQGLSAGILFGCTGVGLLGNEPTLGSPEELALHANAARAAEWERVGVYNLRGLIADGELPIGSRDWRPWLKALLAG